MYYHIYFLRNIDNASKIGERQLAEFEFILLITRD
jgi:hypothetical protein